MLSSSTIPMASTSGKETSVFVLDGGFSTQLARHVGTSADGDPLWSARFLQSHPEDIVQTHLDFLRAGSDIIMTNTYQASVKGFVKHLGVTPEEGYALILRAVSLAKRARDDFLQESGGKCRSIKPLIVGSVGPYAAYLHDGSEYRGNYADQTSNETMREWHTSRIRALIEGGVDFLVVQKKSVDEELFDCKERCRELERAGTPRPHWEICADFISGGRDRWWQLASGLGSRDILRALLKELGPAAESDNLEHFDGLGMDPSIPPYLRYSGRVRNLRLSRREVCVIINHIWLGKAAPAHRHRPMHDYVTNYFEDRYQQPSMRAEWAYNMCAGAEQMLDEPQVKLFWGVLHGHLSEQIYWGLSQQWQDLKNQLYKISKDKEYVTMEEFLKTARALFPLKSEVDIKNLSDVLRRQLKLNMNAQLVSLDKLFQENEEGFERIELARELYRQRQQAQDKYLREIVLQLGGKPAAARPVPVDALKRALALLDPAIDHIRMERYIRWAFSDQSSELSSISPLPLKSIAARLAAGDIERVGPRSRPTHRRSYK